AALTHAGAPGAPKAQEIVMLKTPQDRLRLSRGVGDGLPNDRGDVAALAAALDHFGRYVPTDEPPAAGRSRSAFLKSSNKYSENPSWTRRAEQYRIQEN